MFKFFVICIMLAAVSGQDHYESYHSGDDYHAEVTHINSNIDEHGFHYTYETSNDIKAVAKGDTHGNVQGYFRWISPEGKPIEVSYVADENGYQPQSDVLPTPPPIPEGILKGLAYIKSHPPVVQEDYFKRTV